MAREKNNSKYRQTLEAKLFVISINQINQRINLRVIKSRFSLIINYLKVDVKNLAWGLLPYISGECI